ncbi:MAG: hypothetical protein L0J18_13560 [Tetragenococcus koreensis]|nr:hypothetical protein [Tetragenococcus koreensis]
MEDTLKDIVELINVLPKIEEFKDLTDKELRDLAVELVKIEAINSTDNGVSNAIAHIDYNM